jgi:hypothetical protein
MAIIRSSVLEKISIVWASGNVYYGPKGELNKLPAAFLITEGDTLTDKCIAGTPLEHDAIFNCVLVGEYQNVHSGAIAMEIAGYTLCEKFQEDRKLSGAVTALFIQSVQPDYNVGTEYSICMANVRIRCQFFA